MRSKRDCNQNHEIKDGFQGSVQQGHTDSRKQDHKGYGFRSRTKPGRKRCIKAWRKITVFTVCMAKLCPENTGNKMKKDITGTCIMSSHKKIKSGVWTTEPFKDQVYLSSPTMHGTELAYVQKAYDSGWMSTVGENIDSIERLAEAYTGVRHAVALSCGTAALHLAVKLAAQRLYHTSTGISTPDGPGYGGSLLGRRVFCSDLTFAATVSPVVYEGAEPVFVDVEPQTWNMDPAALERAFELYPDVKLVVFAHLYGTPGMILEIKEICRRHDALLIEDAAESLGASIQGRQTGSFGDYGIISFNGNKIITGSAGGMLLAADEQSACTARKWSTQSREQAPWYQHEQLGYNYRISNVVAGIVRGQWAYLDEHIQKKKVVYDRYRKGLADLAVSMNPTGNGSPNYWLGCLLIEKESMCECERTDTSESYIPAPGKSCPAQILEALASIRAEGRPVWKPMHMQGLYRNHDFVTRTGSRRAGDGEFPDHKSRMGVSEDLFARGLCLPSDIKMKAWQQDRIIHVIRQCFR